MKKAIRRSLMILVLLLTVIVLLPYLFKGRIVESVKQQINEQVNAHVNFEDADLHLLRSFPNIALQVKGLSVLNKEPFEGDTLFYARSVYLRLPVKTIFASGVDPYTVSEFRVDDARVKLIADREGNVNFDIAKKGTEDGGGEKAEGSDSGLRLGRYEFTQVNLVYEDRGQGLLVELDSLNHSGSGDLSGDQAVLRTNSSALLSLVYGETAYLKRNPIDWQADIEMDFRDMAFNFKENTAHINRLPLVFNGGVVIGDEATDIDVDFNTPSSDFVTFLSLIPEIYSGNLEGITTGGTFALNGTVKGALTEKEIPGFRIELAADDAFFKYSGMPLALEEINLRGELANTSGNFKETYLQVDTLHFNLAGDRLDMHLKALELGGSPKLDLSARGVLNLGNFARLMPSEVLEGLQGTLKMNMRSQFDMQDVERGNYAAVKNKGDLQVSNMKFVTSYLPEEILVENAVMELGNTALTLTGSSIRTGNSDLKLKGRIDDYFRIMTENGVVKGRLDMVSDHLEVADLLGTSSFENEETEEVDNDDLPQESPQNEGGSLLPGDLILAVEGKATEVVYNGITLTHATAKMLLSEQKLQISELSSEVFGGRVNLGGVIDGVTATPEYSMDIKASGFNFSDAFGQMDLLKNLMPLARALEGELNSSISISGVLGDDLSPVLSSLTGTLQGDLKVDEVDTDQLGYVQSLNNTFSLVDLSRLGGKVLQGTFGFQEGKVALKPLKFNVNGVDAVIGGTHQFDGEMDYTLTLQVPASYLGKEVTALASSLSIKDLDKRVVPVDVLIKGALKQPSFSTDLEKATAGFVASLSEEKKNELVQKGKGELEKLAEQVSGVKADQNGDTGKVDPVKETAKSLLNNLFKKKKDTINNR